MRAAADPSQRRLAALLALRLIVKMVRASLRGSAIPDALREAGDAALNAGHPAGPTWVHQHAQVALAVAEVTNGLDRLSSLVGRIADETKGPTK